MSPQTGIEGMHETLNKKPILKVATTASASPSAAILSQISCDSGSMWVANAFYHDVPPAAMLIQQSLIAHMSQVKLSRAAE